MFPTFWQNTQLPSRSLASLSSMAGKSVHAATFWMTECESKWCTLLQGHVCKWSRESSSLTAGHSFGEPTPCTGTPRQTGLGTSTKREPRPKRLLWRGSPHALVRLSMCYQCERKMKSRSSLIHCTLGLCIIAAGAGSYWIPTCKELRTVLGHSKLSLNVSFQLSKWKSQYLKTESTVCLQSPQRLKRESYLQEACQLPTLKKIPYH